MKIKAIFVGKTREPYLKEGVEIYKERISRYTRLEIIEVEEEAVKEGAVQKRLREKEAERVLKRVPQGSLLVALDEKGQGMTSEGLAGFIKRVMDSGVREVSFAVGGSLGLGEKVKDRADMALSLSPMTLTHQLARLILLEQIYRAFTIIKGEPYHK